MTTRQTVKFTVTTITALLLFLLPALSFGQALTGTKYVATSGGDYTSIKLAIVDLNLNGVGTGGVIINVPGGWTETAPVGGDTITATGTAANPIVFQKDPATIGANPLITSFVGTSTTIDGIFFIMGGSYITINGIDLVESAANITTTTQMEWGYALVKRYAIAPFIGCQHDTIKNCTITLNRTNTVSKGIYSNNHTKYSTTALAITLTSDANSYNGFVGNTVQNVNTGIYVYGFAAVAPYTLYDQSNYVYGNSILNFVGAAQGYGVYMYYQSYNNISNNIIDNYNNGVSGAIGASAYIYGIYNYNSTASANPSNLVANNNYIKMTQAASSTGYSYGIYHYYSQGNITINNNTLKFATLGAVAATGYMYGIYAYPSSYANGTVQMKNNHIDSCTVNNSTGYLYGYYLYYVGTNNDVSGNTITYFTRNLGTTGGLYGFYMYGASYYSVPGTVFNFYNNVIDSINQGVSTGTIYGMQYISGCYTVNNYNNTVSRIYAPSNTTLYGIYPYYYATNYNFYNNTVNTLVNAGTIYGVYWYGYYFANSNFYNNTISNLTSSGSNNVCGLYVYYSASTAMNIYKNKFYSYASNGAAGGAAQGIFIYNSTSGAPATMPVKIYNNLISDLQAPLSNNTQPSVNGINIGYASYNFAANIYDNNIYLSGTGSPYSNSSCVFQSVITPTIRLNNNILVNKLNHAGTGFASAIYRIGSSLGTLDPLTNNNILYAGVPSSKNLYYYDGTNKDSVMATYKSRVSPRETNTSTENITFINTLPLLPNYLQPDSTIATNIESGGINIAGITDDYTGRIRAGNAGYIGTGSASDVGAYEGNYTPIPMVYDSCNADQVMSAVLAGKTNQAVLRMRIYTENVYGPLAVTKFKLNTSGTTSIANISNAKVFYTGGSSNFNSTAQFGSVVAAPNGVFYVTGTQALSSGANYFWLTYDISASASLSNVVDGRWDSVMVAGVNRAPINGDPISGTPISLPLAGSYTIGTGTYMTLAAAIADLNNKGMTSTVTINVPAGYTEQAPVGGYLLGSSLLNSNLSASSRLNIVKNGAGTNPLLFANTGTSASSDGLFMIQGCDYVTINGIDLIDTNTVSATTQMEQGFGLVKLNGTAPFDGCQYDTIMNCTVTLNRTNINSRGLYVNNAIASDATTSFTITAPSDANSYNALLNNTIQNTSSAIVLGGFMTASPHTLADVYNTVRGNTILNFNGAGSTAYGIWMMNQINNVVTNNIIDNYNNGVAGAVGATSTMYGIYNFHGNTSGSNYSNVNVSNNYVKLTMANGSSATVYNIQVDYSHGNVAINNNTAKWATIGVTACTGSMYGIWFNNNTGTTSTSLQFKNNHFDTITVNNSTGYVYLFYGYAGAANEDYSGNTFTYFTRTGGTTAGIYGFYFTYNPNYGTVGTTTNFYNNVVDSINNGASTGTIYGAMVAGCYNFNIYNNTFNRIYTTGTGTIYTLYPYYYGYNVNIYNNTISNVSGGAGVYGLYDYGYYFMNQNIYSNNIFNIRTTAANTVNGLYLYYAGMNTCNVYKNKVYSLSANIAGASVVNGIYVLQASFGAPSNMPIKVYNNLVSDLQATASTSSPSISGLVFGYSSYTYIGYAYYNSIYLNGTGGASATSTGVYCASLTPQVLLGNNIIINNVNHTTGTAAALYRLGTALTTYNLASNNNLFYAGTPSISHVIYYDGTNKDQTLAAFKSRIAPAEGSSFTENTTFISTSPASVNYLQPDSTIATAIESGALNIAGLTDDFKGRNRQGNTGYTGTGTAPDVGAIEGNYTLNDVIPPIFTVTPTVANTASTGDRAITVNISDNTGISVQNLMYAPYLPPVLYYKKTMLGSFFPATGTKVSGNGKNGTWTFTVSAINLGGTLSLGDSIYYFIVAQDSSANTILGSAPGGATGLDVNTLFTTPSNLYSYKIVPGMSGTYNVGGATYDYYNLTNPSGAFDAINNSALSGNVTLKVSGDLNESGLITLKKWSETGAGNFTVKVVPDGTTERAIIDTVAANTTAVLTFDGCSRATIDGRYNGSGKYLRIRNRAPGGFDFKFQNDATHDTIEYCYIECINNTVGSITFGGTTVIGGRGNDSNVVTFNNIGDTLGAIAPAGASNTGVFSQGTVGMENDANIISNNNIYNITFNVINLTGSGTGNYWTIYGNKVYQTANRSTASSYYMFSVSQGYGHIFRKNSIGGASPDRSGIPIYNTSNYWYVFYQTSTNIVPNIYDSNTIANFNTPYLYPFYMSNGAATITNNVIGGKQNVWDTVVVSGQIYGMYLSGNNNFIVDRNTISNIAYTGGATGYFTGIYDASYGTTNTITNNSIHDMTGNGSGTLPTVMYNSGISLYNTSTGGAITIDNNTIYNISNTGSGYAAGIGIYYAYSTMNITRNKVYGISSANSFTEGIYGPYYNYNNVNFVNNQVTLSPLGNGGSVVGMHDASYYGGTSNNYFNNSVFVGGISNGASNSYAYFRNGVGGTDIIDVRNNIFYNKRIGGTGFNYAVGYTNNTIIVPSTINYNLMAVTDTSKVLELPSATATGVAGVNAIYAGSYNSNWMARTTDVPAQTLFTDTAVANMSIVTANANSWYANGKGIAVAAVSTDYSGAARSTTIAGGATDLGAFEFSTLTTPPAATASAAPALSTTTNYTFAGRTVASMTWGATGTVPTSVAVNYYTGTTAPSLLASKTQYNSYYVVTPTGGSAFTYSIALNYDSSMFGNVTSSASSRMARYKSPNWNLLTTSSATLNGAMLSSGASLAATTLPANFTGTDNTNPLPVNLVSINANKVNSDVIVNWFTASELNSNRFEIERSFDNNSFEYAGSVNAAGNSNRVISYSFNDINIVPNATGNVIYYRLKMVDKDGSFDFSNTVAVKINHDQIANQVSVYPNPFNNNLNLSVIANASGNATITISDITGKKLMSINHDVEVGNNNINADQAASLHSGLYFISFEMNGIRQVMKLVKE